MIDYEKSFLKIQNGNDVRGAAIATEKEAVTITPDIAAFVADAFAKGYSALGAAVAVFVKAVQAFFALELADHAPRYKLVGVLYAGKAVILADVHYGRAG